MSGKNGLIWVIPDPQRVSTIEDYVERFGSFSDTLSKPDLNPKVTELALVSLDGETLAYAALARRGSQVATAKYAVRFTNIVNLADVTTAELEAHVTAARLKNFASVMKGGGRHLTPETWAQVWSGIKSVRPALGPALDQLEALSNLGPASYRDQTFSTIAQEKDAVTTALDIFGYDRRQFFGRWTPPEENEPAPFLKGLQEADVIEDIMIEHDKGVFGDWMPGKEYQVGAVVLTKGDEKLTVLNVNRTSVEKTLGVDLIYYLHRYKSFVMVQYKPMKAEGTPPTLVYRPLDKSYAEELQRMEAFLKTQPPFKVSAPDEYRFSPNPFLFKLCSKTVLDPFSTGLLPGMYIPLDYWQVLVKSPAAKGPQGGIRITHDAAGRWLDNTLFVHLVQKGWIGSPISSEKQLASLVEAGLKAKRSLIYAASSQHVPTDSTDDFDIEDDGEDLAG